MNSKIFITVMMLFLIGMQRMTGQSQDQGELKFSLKQAVDYALQNNQNAKNATLDFEKAKKKVWETTAIGLPNLNGSVSYQNTFDVPALSSMASVPIFGMIQGTPVVTGFKTEPYEISFGDPQTTTWDLTLSQLIFSGEYIVGLQASRTYKMFSQQNIDKTNQDVKDAVSGAYYTVLMVRENLNILDSSYQNTMKLVSEMEQMNKAGLNDETDVAQLKLVALNLKNSMLTIERQLNLATNLLKLNMGVDIEKTIVLTDNLSQQIAAVDAGYGLKEFNLNSNINYQLLLTQEQLAKLSLKQQESKVLPTISAYYRHFEYMKDPSFSFQQPNTVGVSVSVPIFASGSRYSKISQAKLDVEKMENMKEMASDGIMLEYKQAKSDFETAIAKYSLVKENLQLSQKIYNNTLTKFKNGLASSLELTQVNNQYLTSQSNFYSASYELLTAKLKLDKVLNNK